MIDAIYYDGNTSRRYPVTLYIQKRVLAMRGEGVRRTARLSQMEVSERLENAPRILRFSDGAFIEASDQRKLDRMLKENRFTDPRVVRWQNNWPLSLLALVTLVTALLSLYQWGVPLAADQVAQRLPASWSKEMGEQSLAMIDQRFMRPSTLPVAEQERLRARFASLQQPDGVKTPYQLLFRSSRMGPNAFALPHGVIIMTDEMVRETANDDAVIGILAHELGHVRRKHAARHVLQGIGVGLVLNLWVGDVSSALVAAPMLLLNQKHSRDFEREADQYAIDMMLANGVPLEPLAARFDQMGERRPASRRAEQQAAQDDPDEEADEDEMEGRAAPPDYLSSHPSDRERSLRLRDAAMRARVNAPVQ